MENYKPNSHKYKAEEKKKSSEEREKLDPIVSKGSAKIRKKSLNRKITDVLISEDASNVKSYILSDVLIPAVKKLISDIVRDGIEMVLYGGTGHSGGYKRSGASLISYDRFYNSEKSRPASASRAKIGYSHDDISFTTRGEAEEVLDRMCELIDMYGSVAVADLYDLAGLTHQYTDNKFGWDNLRTAEPFRVRDGYILKLPRAKPIE